MLENIKSWLVEKLGGIYITRDQTYSEINFYLERKSRENLNEMFQEGALEGEEITLHITNKRVNIDAEAKCRVEECNINSLWGPTNIDNRLP